MTVKVVQWTANDLIRLPSGQGRFELIRGGLKEKTPAGHVHGRVAARFLGRLITFVEDRQLGAVYAAETGFLINRDPDTVRGADVAFVSTKRLEAASFKSEGYFPGPPDLAVEVVSPSDTYSEVQEKVLEWLTAGSKVVITVDPRRKIVALYRQGAETLFLKEEDSLSIPDLIADWSVSLRDVFV